MRFRLLLICLAAGLLLSPKKTLAQGQYVINNDLNLINNFHTVTPDGSIFIYAEHSYGQSYLLKLNNKNEVVWSKSLQMLDSLVPYPDELMNMTAIAAMPDNGIILIGYVETGDLINNWNITMTRFDSDGNVIWSNHYEGLYSEEPQVVLVRDNTIHIAGIGHSIQAMPSAVFYATISFDGEIKDFNTKWIQNQRVIKGMNISPDGWICLASESFMNNKNALGAIDILDPGGNFRYFYSLSGVADNIYPEQIEVAGDKFIVTGRAVEQMEAPYTFLLHINSLPSSGTLQGTYYKIKGDLPISGHAMAKESDTSFFIGGLYDFNLLWQQKVFLGRIVLRNANFVQDWGKVYGKNTFHSLASLGMRPNGTLTGVGTCLYSPHLNDIYVIETKPDGQTGCDEKDFQMTVEKKPIAIAGDLPENVTRNWTQYSSKLLVKPVDFSLYESLCPLLPPVAGFSLTDTLICPGEGVFIEDTAKYASEYNWYFEGTDTAKFHDSDPPELFFKEAGVYKLTQIISNLHGSDTAVRYIEVKSLPNADAGSDKKVCPGNTTILEASGGVKYEWYLNGELINDGNSATVTVSPALSQRYIVVAYNEAACSDFDEVYVVVLPLLTEPPGYRTGICLGDSTTLGALEDEGVTYLWSTGETSPYIWVKEAGTYKVIISNECSVKEVDFGLEVEDCNLYWSLPNAFTPNGDGLNDSFSIIGQNIREAELKIYSRWGQLLYSGTGSDVSWDGTFKGKPCQQDEYLYTIKVQGIKYEKQHGSGTLNLSR